jgi:hypothetical protein
MARLVLLESKGNRRISRHLPITVTQRRLFVPICSRGYRLNRRDRDINYNSESTELEHINSYINYNATQNT